MLVDVISNALIFSGQEVEVATNGDIKLETEVSAQISCTVTGTAGPFGSTKKS